MPDCQWKNLNFSPSQIDHNYGDNVFIISDPYCASLLTKLSSPETFQPSLNFLVEKLYRELFRNVANIVFPRKSMSTKTRMFEFTNKGVLEGEVIDPDSKSICVGLARAGTYPSHICFEELCFLTNPANVRQDHFYMNRKVDHNDQVIGVDVSGSKIGGDQEGRVVLFPDPMGATGGSLSHAISHYKNNVEGIASRYVAMHFIITPEYIQKLKSAHPDVLIFTLRLDRGLSENDILNTVPGSQIARERGLTDKQYIVPGAGGVGEILNNSFV